MTVATTTNKAIFTGNGSTTVFPFTFGTLPSGDLVVTLYDLSNVAIPQTEITHYTVQGKGEEDGGSVTFITPPPTGYKVLIQRLVPFTQPTDLKNQGSFYPRTHERAFDRSVMQAQQLDEVDQRAMRLPPQVEGVSTQMPVPQARSVVGWNNVATGLQNYTFAELATVVAYADKHYQTFTGTGAQTNFTLNFDPGSLGNLEITIDGVMQVPTTDFTYSGTTLTFTTAPANLAVILVRYDQGLPTGITDAAAVNYTPPSTGLLGSIKSFLDSLWTASATTGAALIRFIQAGAGAVARTSQAKMRDTVHADDFGLIGDGATDETTAIQNMLNAAQGKVLMLGYGKTYAFASATGLSFPANTTMFANGSKFKRLQAKSGAVTDADYNITFGADTWIDKFELDCVGGGADIGGVIVGNSRTTIGTLKINTPTSGSGSAGSAWNAVRIGPNSGSAANIRIGEVACANWDRPIIWQNCARSRVDYVDIATYLRGIYAKDLTACVLNGGHIRTMGPNGTGAAGENGILIEATVAHWSTDGVRVNNVTIENAGEHSCRVGGQLNCRNIWFTNCHSIASGSGGATANGGCGFKALGPTSVFGARHVNIHVENCSAFDINIAGASGASNFAGVQLGKVFGASVTNFVCGVTPASSGTYGESGNSAQNGVEIIGCQKVTITNPQIQRPSNSGVYIYDFTDGVNDWGQTDDIDIVGGHVQTPGDAGVEIDCSVITMRRISIQGSMKVNAGSYTMKVNKSGTGAFVACFADMHSINPATESFNGLGTDWTIRAVGSFVGANACRNGSFYQDDTNAVLKKRAAGAWTNL